MNPNRLGVSVRTAVLTICALSALVLTVAGSLNPLPAAAQTIVSGPVLAPVMVAGGPIVGAPVVTPLGFGSTYILPGQYCTDKTGGQMYIPDGAPVPDGVTCPGSSMMSSGTMGGNMTMVSPPAPTTLAAAPSTSGTITETQTTASYRVELDIEPPQTMLMPDQAANATSGEVMVMMPGMTMDMMMAMMSMTDQGQQVNHHVEAHIYDKATGAVVNDMMPMIKVMDQATGTTRDLQNLMAMYDVKAGKSDLHFGNNIHLPDGMYTITVTIGQEKAVFKDVHVTSAASSATAR